MLPGRVLGESVEPGLTEIFGMVKAQIKRSGYAHLIPAGIVVTGGTALLRGLGETAGERLDLPARVGVPDVSGSMADTVGSPAYATGVGLVLHAARKQGPGRMVRSTNGTGSFFGRMRQWVREFTQGA